MSKIIGIDLGTTYSAVAVVEGGQPKMIENLEGLRTTPSVAAVARNGERLVGVLARRQAVTNPENTIYGIKRFMGHVYDDPAVQTDTKTAPYKVEKGKDNGVLVKMGDKSYRPEEISAMILQKIKTDTEAKLGIKITEAVITVPAYFNDAQRKATKDAGAIAGLDVKRIINEPTAAALAYGLNKKANEKIAVYDFGGGTFDISVLEVSNDVIEVKSTDGDHHLGGEDFDQIIVKWIAGEFKKQSGIDVSKDTLALQRLKEEGQKAKHELSTTLETDINIPFITSDAAGPKHLFMKMSRTKLEELTRSFIDRSIEITKRAMEASPFKISDIDEIIMVGGQTRMPAIVAAVKNYFNKEPNLSINPDEVVALGAAIQAGILGGDVRDVLLLDVIPLSLGIETLGSVATKLIEKNTTIPASKSQVFSTAADNQTSVEIHIVQGERPMASDNKSLGRFILDGIPPSVRGLPQIEVVFDVDVNGILKVTAKDKTTGKTQSIRIEASSGLSQDDIKKMQADAETHAEDDRKKKELADFKNTAEMSIYAAEKALKDNEAKIPEDVKKEVNDKISALRAVKDGSDLAALKRATEDLSTSLSKIGEAISKAQPSPEASAGTASESSKSSEESKSSETGDKKDEGDNPDGNIRDAEVK
ncbi:molecular chaperone DnaK [Candidatus Nomurabacteria bacterium RIFCSPLOWO2_01_FULL_42_20]|uniref:Chaperone protein DnaK n=1 Tax=Candidatus Nomurabacteria bacterium RIFCSPHIGHO2_01_FULL_42_16 TaxID=1801743 RepID=A0A1F6VHX5_9BACT|nr:MAG: molecular chaperone DnaK [Candidatus Nomurabacteria bacterium RIFCSPHIGHO2_01_FULL_42_16]OGI91595.1 MAG: molecular chaperone DnaK [Candidatus Nomurabacteria bacterium RIFCSPLOWO2_01_FULL_42_20]